MNFGMNNISYKTVKNNKTLSGFMDSKKKAETEDKKEKSDS